MSTQNICNKASSKKQLLFFGVLICLCFALQQATAQVTPPATNEQQTNDNIERVAENGVEGIDYDEFKMILDELARNPINLNRATKEQLVQMGLLTEYQINQLFEHIEKYGDLIALPELQTIDGFELDDIQRILPYVRVNGDLNAIHLSFNEYLRKANKQILVRTQRVLNAQAGYNPVDSEATQYLGSPFKLYLRYLMTYQRKFSFGVVAEKDAGEPFFTGPNKTKGFDYYSAHLFIRDIGRIKSLAIGDYQVEYGQGLTVWSGLAFGKSVDPATVIRFANGLRPYTSVNETQFRRGAAISFEPMKHLRLDAYYSNKNNDGNVAIVDSLNQIGDLSSLQTSGYHRTQNEIDDQGAVRVISYGGHASYRRRKFEIGLTGASTQLSSKLEPSTALYKQFQVSGDRFFNVGVDYKLLYRNFNFFGETSRSQNGAFATIDGVIMSLDPKFTVTLLYRNFDKKYENIESNAIAESGNNNEKGFYMGATLKPIRAIGIMGYFDTFEFPWLKYLVNAPSRGYEYAVQLTYTPNKKVEMYVRQRFTQKPGNVSSMQDNPLIDYLVETRQANTRFNLAFKVSPAFTLRSRIEFVNYTPGNLPKENGYLIFQDFIYKPMRSPVSINIRYAMFDTKSYDSRLYAYESNVYGAYSIPPMYLKGSRYYILINWDVVRHVQFYIRYAQTVYDNRITVGSGLDQINGNSKSDIDAALKIDF